MKKKVISILLIILLINLTFYKSYINVQALTNEVSVPLYDVSFKSVIDPNGTMHTFDSRTTAHTNNFSYTCGALPPEASVDATYANVPGYLTFLAMRVFGNGSNVTMYYDEGAGYGLIVAYNYTFNGVYYQLTSAKRFTNQMYYILGIDTNGIVAGPYPDQGSVVVFKFTSTYDMTVYGLPGTRYSDGMGYVPAFYLNSDGSVTGYSPSYSPSGRTWYMSTESDYFKQIGDSLGLYKIYLSSGEGAYSGSITNSKFTWYYNVKGYAYYPRVYADSLSHKGTVPLNYYENNIVDAVYYKDYFYVAYANMICRSKDLQSWELVYTGSSIARFIVFKDYLTIQKMDITYDVSGTPKFTLTTSCNSTDGVNWVDRPGSYQIVEIYYLNGVFYAYYNINNPYSSPIGLYKSNDGINWSFYANVSSTATSYDGSKISPYPTYVYSNGGKFYTSFSVSNEDTGEFKNGFMVSTDLIHWSETYSAPSKSNVDTSGNYIWLRSSGDYETTLSGSLYVVNQSSGYPNWYYKATDPDIPYESYYLPNVGSVKIRSESKGQRLEVDNKIVWVHGFNNPPTLTCSSSGLVYYKKGVNLVLSGNATDIDGDGIVVSATIGGVTKSTSLASSGNWTLSWSPSGDGVPDGTYTNIVINAKDTKGASSAITISGTLVIDTINPNAPVIQFHN